MSVLELDLENDPCSPKQRYLFSKIVKVRLLTFVYFVSVSHCRRCGVQVVRPVVVGFRGWVVQRVLAARSTS